MKLHLSRALLLLCSLAAPLTLLWAAETTPPAVSAQDVPNAVLGQLSSTDVISGPRTVLYDPIPSTTVTSPVNGQLFTSAAPVVVTGVSYADCSVDEKASPTNVGNVQFREGTAGSWTNIPFSTTPDGCIGNWGFFWTPPIGLVNQPLTLQFRTITIHGPAVQRDVFTQSVPTSVQVRIDTPFNQVILATPGAIRAETFPVAWSIQNASNVQSFALEYSRNGVDWALWQTNPVGTDAFGFGLDPVLTPGSKVYFRARVTLTGGLQTPYVSATVIWPTNQLFLPAVQRERGLQ